MCKLMSWKKGQADGKYRARGKPGDVRDGRWDRDSGGKTAGGKNAPQKAEEKDREKQERDQSAAFDFAACGAGDHGVFRDRGDGGFDGSLWGRALGRQLQLYQKRGPGNALWGFGRV